MQKTVFALLSLALAAGCGPHRYLVWQSSPPAPALMGRTAINVADRREPQKGGTDPTMLGFQRSGFGIPFPIRLHSPAQLSMDVHALLTEAALASGVAVLPPGLDGAAGSRVMVEIQNFWCDGYWPVYKGGVTASVTIVDGASNQVRVPGQPLMAEGQSGNCREAYHRALTTLFMNARAMFSAPPIHDALVASAGGPPPSPAQ